MRVRFTIGVGNGDEDRDLLERSRRRAGSASSDVDPARRPPGWPAPIEREGEDGDPARSAWAW